MHTKGAGSDYYIAPEVIKGMKYDKSADIWSIGVIWYQLLTGCLEIFKKSDELSQVQLDNNINFNKNIDEAGKNTIKKILHINPKNRIQLTDLIKEVKEKWPKQQERIHDQCYHQDIKIYNNNAVLWQNDGLAIMKQNRFQKIIDFFYYAIETYTKIDYEWNKTGLALKSLNKFQEAIVCFDEAIKINPNYDSAWNNKGSALNSLNKFQEAIVCFDEAIKINPNYDSAWYNKDSLNKFQEAIVCYDQAIKINPKHKSAFRNKGFSLHNLKHFKASIQCFDQSIAIDMNPITLRLKGDSLFELKSKSEAKKCYFTALQLGSNEEDYIKKQLSKL